MLDEFGDEIDAPNIVQRKIPRFELCGFDLADGLTCALPNCQGGFDEAISYKDLNEFGIVSDYNKANSIQKKLYDEDHTDCVLFAFFLNFVKLCCKIRKDQTRFRICGSGLVDFAVCDDEREMADFVAEELREFYPSECEIKCYDNGESMFSDSTRELFDAFFLHIAMPGLDGFALAEKIRSDNPLAR